MNPRPPPGSSWLRHAEPKPAADLERFALQRLRAELALVRRITRAERERIATLAEQWGHASFAQFLREQPADD